MTRQISALQCCMDFLKIYIYSKPFSGGRHGQYLVHSLNKRLSLQGIVQKTPKILHFKRLFLWTLFSLFNVCVLQTKPQVCFHTTSEGSLKLFTYKDYFLFLSCLHIITKVFFYCLVKIYGTQFTIQCKVLCKQNAN